MNAKSSFANAYNLFWAWWCCKRAVGSLTCVGTFVSWLMLTLIGKGNISSRSGIRGDGHSRDLPSCLMGCIEAPALLAKMFIIPELRIQRNLSSLVDVSES